MKTLFKNAKVLQLNQDKGYIEADVVVEDNKILFVGNGFDANVDKIVDVAGNILMPGFVDAHAHSAMTILRSLKDDVNLQDWLFNNIFPREEKMTENDVYWGTMLAICEYLRAGITTVQDYYFHEDGLIRAFNECGFRASVAMGYLTSGRGESEEYLKAQLEQINNSKLLYPVCTSHSIYVKTKEQLESLAEFANKHNLPKSLHLSETKKEVDDCVRERGILPTEYLEGLGYLDNKCTTYHGVHLTDKEFEILKKHNANIVTCPSSNIKLASGIANVRDMQKHGINVAIGTDGASSNNNLDMFKEMFLVATLSKVQANDPAVVSARDVLKMATVNGAKALYIDDVGEIKVGNNADIILVDTTKPHMQPCDNVLSNLVYCAKSSDVYFTMIDGKVLFENGKVNLPVDEQTIIEKVNEIRQRLA